MSESLTLYKVVLDCRAVTQTVTKQRTYRVWLLKCLAYVDCTIERERHLSVTRMAQEVQISQHQINELLAQYPRLGNIIAEYQRLMSYKYKLYRARRWRKSIIAGICMSDKTPDEAHRAGLFLFVYFVDA